MPLNKPIKGAVNWDVALNAALDYLDSKPGPTGPTGPAGNLGPTGPTGAAANLLSVGSNVVPITDNTYSLGTSEKRWSAIYLGPGTLYITDTTLGTDAEVTINNGVFNLNGVVQAQLPDVHLTEITFGDNTTQSTAYVPPAAQVFSPNLTATGIVVNPVGVAGKYVKSGDLISFWITVDCSYISNFGTGQWHFDFPFEPDRSVINHFEGGAYEPDGTHSAIRADSTQVANAKIDLHYLKAAGPNSAIQEAAFTSVAPITLDSAAKVYLNGTYLAA